MIIAKHTLGNGIRWNGTGLVQVIDITDITKPQFRFGLDLNITLLSNHILMARSLMHTYTDTRIQYYYNSYKIVKLQHET